MDLEEYVTVYCIYLLPKKRCQELVDGETKARAAMVHGESIDEVRVVCSSRQIKVGENDVDTKNTYYDYD